MHELIFKNFWLKVFSLLLAMTMWYVLHPSTGVEGEPTNFQEFFRPAPTTREFRCPVTLLEAPSEKRCFQVEPTFVMVQVSGDSIAVKQLGVEDVQAYVNISTVKEPEGAYRIETLAPKGITVKSVSYSHASVKPSG
jgi:hypothetical protein